MIKKSLFIKNIPYEIATETLFQRIRHLPRPVLLDSNSNNSGIDIIAAAPCTTILGGHSESLVASTNGSSFRAQGCPFKLLEDQLSAYAACTEVNLPFTGGAIGSFSYDLGRSLHPIEIQTRSDFTIPTMDIGIYLWAIIRDHNYSKTYFVARPECSKESRTSVLELVTGEHIIKEQSPKQFELMENFRSNLSFQQYSEGFRRIAGYLEAGDCYQVNYARRYQAAYQGDEWQAYLKLRAITDGSFSGFMQKKGYALLSFSPERFIQVKGGQVETRPIKGTSPRNANPKQDQQYAQQLRNSVKDRAENLMIVDLMRNDISRNCALGSVEVTELFDIESYSNVHHMVSTIRGQLAEGKTALQLLRDCFPGGSITGAPKTRAMQIIEELEPHRRNFYCGSLGYLDFNGNMDTSIAIRTLIAHNNQLYCWGGGAIVADSNVDDEYRESCIKVSNLLNALGDTMSSKATYGNLIEEYETS